MNRKRTAPLVLVGLFLWLTACSRYTQIELSEVADHERVRVTLTDGERETIHQPWVEANSIRSTDAQAIPLEQVAELEAVGTDEVGAVFMVLGGVALVLIVACAAACDFDYFGN